MFKKLISNLPFNPSLITQVSFYAKRLHREEKLRRLGAIMVVLAIMIQMFAVISPPEPTLAESDNDILRGGFTSRDEAVAKCRANQQGFATILDYYFLTNGNLGATCDLLARATTHQIRSTDNGSTLDSMGRTSQGPTIARTGKPTNEYSVNIPGAGTFYMRNLWAWDSGAPSTYQMLSIVRSDGKSVMIMFNCGNIVTNGFYGPPVAPPPPPPPPPPPVVTTGEAICTSLVATPLNERSFRFKATTSGNNYTVKSYQFNFGDGKSQTLNTASTSATIEHTYDATKTYNANAVVSVSIKSSNGTTTAKSLSCQTSLTTNTPDVCPMVPGTQTNKTECDVCKEIPGEQSNPAECKPCDNSKDDQDTKACLVLNKAAKNNTQKIENADGTTAAANDSISYTLRTKNAGKATVKQYVIEENMSDVLDYATITDLAGGQLGSDNIVRWPATDIAGGETVTKVLGIKVKSPIPATPISASDGSKFDLVMNNVYGNAINIKLPSPIIKTTEIVTTKTLPNTGPGTTMMLSVMMAVVVGYFFMRSRLMAEEMDMVRNEFAMSGSN